MEDRSREKRSWLAKGKGFKKYAKWKANVRHQQCLAYYQEELQLKVFQEKEIDLYQEAAVTYGMSAGTDSEVAGEMLPAARRQAESANEILRRRGEIALVPDAASAMYFAWQIAYSDQLAWATAQSAAVSAVANGMVPHAERVRKLLSRSEKSLRKAERITRRFVRRLGLSNDEARKMLIKASMTVADENWQPGSQSADELALLRKRISQLEESEIEHRQAEEEFRQLHNYSKEVAGERSNELATANDEQLGRELAEYRRAHKDMVVKDCALASAISAIVMVDLESNLTYANRSFFDLWGYTDEEEVLGKPFAGLWQAEGEVSKMLETLRDYGSWTGELVAVRKDGSLFTAHVLANRVTNEVDELLGFMGSFVDITEHKKTQEQLIIADRLTSLGELASGFAHELNNPLMGAIGLCELLMDKKGVSNNIRQDVVTIHNETRRAAEVIRKFLSFADKRLSEKRLTDVNSVIESVLEMRENQHKASNIRVNTRFTSNLPEVMAASSQLQQVFLYIIMNSEYFMVKANNEGVLTVTTEKVGDDIKISFADDGPGISKQDLAHVFDPFFSTKEVGDGIGLGLSICYRIIAEHGGRINVESELGKGAAFTVELPVATEARKMEPAKTADDASQKVTGAKILVVDDEPTILQFLSDVLTDKGHEVVTINSASDALEKVRSERYSLILLDIKMPGISGIELYKRFQEIAQSLARRVVFITGDALGTDTSNFLSETNAHCIAKPFDIEQLERDINQVLARGA